jgi:hypothetical protein
MTTNPLQMNPELNFVIPGAGAGRVFKLCVLRLGWLAEREGLNEKDSALCKFSAGRNLSSSHKFVRMGVHPREDK